MSSKQGSQLNKITDKSTKERQRSQDADERNSSMTRMTQGNAATQSMQNGVKITKSKPPSASARKLQESIGGSIDFDNDNQILDKLRKEKKELTSEVESLNNRIILLNNELRSK